MTLKDKNRKLEFKKEIPISQARGALSCTIGSIGIDIQKNLNFKIMTLFKLTHPITIIISNIVNNGCEGINDVSHPLNLLHIDLRWLGLVISDHNYSYYVSFVDEYSRYN